MKSSNETKYIAATRVWRSFANAVVGISLTCALARSASAQSLTWDNTSTGNPYVAAGFGGECTAFAYGRYKLVNSEALRFVNPEGRAVYPNAGLMFDYVTETPTTYRDSVPVRGGLATWKKSGTPGHTAAIERIYSDGSADIAEQNWPLGSGPNSKTLTAAKLQSRPSTSASGQVSYYTLAGYVNPNRAPAYGTAQLTRSSSTLQLGVPLLDEDRRLVSIVGGIFDGGSLVSGTAVSGTINPNVTMTVRWGSTGQLQSGRAYTIWLWATDFRGLRSARGWTFTWQ